MNRPKSIGLYSWRMVKRENSITFSAGIVVGVTVAMTGIAMAAYILQGRAMEQQSYGRSEPHVFAWITAAGLVLIGIFLAHAGVIHFWRKLLRKRLESSGN